MSLSAFVVVGLTVVLAVSGPSAARVGGTAASKPDSERVQVALSLPTQGSPTLPPPTLAAPPALPAPPPAEAPAEPAPQVQLASLEPVAREAAADVTEPTRTEPPAARETVAVAPAPEPGQWQTVEVRSGDTLSAIFKRQSLSPSTLHDLLQAEGLGKELQRIRPGEEIRLRTDDGALLELAYAPDALTTLHVRAGDGGWEAETVATPLETRSRFVGGIISASLYASALEAGLDDRLIMELAGIFGWDVDFALDIRAGDRFGVLFEEFYGDDGEKLDDGAILAASFTNQGKTFHAVRFTGADGYASYYSPDGYSMRKAFLRSPVDFRRISSRFRGSRYHPVLGVKRPHRGVDYAAATGTPIKASGDGKVVHLGRKGGYGKTVILQHGGRYRTLYGHMSNYARGLRSGARVRQGQVIGYVGATGLATGPHLHYEFLVDGVHRNPLTVELPKADPIDRKLLPDFRAVAEPLLAQLALHEQTLLAQNRD